MKCPILVMGRMNSSDPQDISFTECIQTGCAWWMKADGICALPSIAATLNGLEDETRRVADNIKGVWPR